MLKFKKIEIDDIEIYKNYIQNTKEFSCENSFVNLLVWQCAYNNMIAEKDGLLFIKSGLDDKETFRLPYGKNLAKGIELINEYCGEKKPRFWAQDGENLENFKQNIDLNYVLKENRDAFDYIYLWEDLANLSGKKYHSKRNHINAFSKKFKWQYKKITEDNLDAVRECAKAWYNENSDRIDRHMQCEKNGIELMLNNFNRLSITGGAIWVDEKIVAFTLGSAINNEIFDVHIEKSLSDYSEAYTVINNQFVKNELSGYRYINREDDMGLEGLRKAKLSYKPSILLKKYYCYMESNDE